MSLLIESPLVKQRYFDLLKTRIPTCLKCFKLFKYGFPKSEEALSDYLICLENELICTCENAKIVEELSSTEGNALVDLKNYYS